MKVTFIQSECESLAVGLLSSILKKKGHEVYLVFDPRVFAGTEVKNRFMERLFSLRECLLQEALDSKPDLFAFSAFTYNYQWALNFAQAIRDRCSTPIIFGGVHPTVVPEVVLKNACVDIVCVGEGENSLPDVLESLEKGSLKRNINNIWSKENGSLVKNPPGPLIENLDLLPYPDKELFYEKEPIFRKHYNTVAGRGCPYFCSYCETKAIRELSTPKGSKYLRRRSVDSMIDELVWARKKFGFTSLNFNDDVFTSSVTWLRDFVPKYKERIGIPFFCTAHPNCVNDETVTLLQEAGCYMLGMGVQSVSEDTRRKVINRPVSNARILAAGEACKNGYLRFTVDHIFNIPGEGAKEQIDALNFYNQMRPDIINTFWLTYLPKTGIINTALESGLLDYRTIDRINEGKESTSMVIGVGGEYSFSQDRMESFAFLMTILPLVPKGVFEKLIEKVNFIQRFKPPLIINVMAKFLNRLRLGRGIDTLFTAEVLFARIFYVLYKKLLSNNKIKKEC